MMWGLEHRGAMGRQRRLGEPAWAEELSLAGDTSLNQKAIQVDKSVWN